MKYFLLIALMVAAVRAEDSDLHPQSDEFINIVNAKATTWKVRKTNHLRNLEAT